jgi:hypothetical protein
MTYPAVAPVARRPRNFGPRPLGHQAAPGLATSRGASLGPTETMASISGRTVRRPSRRRPRRKKSSVLDFYFGRFRAF